MRYHYMRLAPLIVMSVTTSICYGAQYDTDQNEPTQPKNGQNMQDSNDKKSMTPAEKSMDQQQKKKQPPAKDVDEVYDDEYNEADY